MQINRLIEVEGYTPFKLMRPGPYKVTRQRLIHLPVGCLAAAGDRYFVYENNDGDLMMIRKQ